jgi:hypothetical protein
LKTVWSLHSVSPSFGFLGIKDVCEVKALIHKALLGEGDDEE